MTGADAKECSGSEVATDSSVALGRGRPGATVAVAFPRSRIAIAIAHQCAGF